MGLRCFKEHKGILKIGLILIGLAWVSPASGVNIQLGGGPNAELSRFPVLYRETFDSGKPKETVFWGALDVGQRPKDPWTGMLVQDAYTLTHTGKPGAVRYYFRHRINEHHLLGLAAFPLSVEVEGTMNDALSGAGLIYGYDPQTRYYLAFVKGTGKTYAIYNRNAAGFRKIVGGTSEAINPSRTNQLAIVPEGSKIKFYINGIQMATMEDEGATSGGAGLVAISSGMYLFDNFTIYKRPQKADAVPTRGRDDRMASTASLSGGQKRTKSQAGSASTSNHRTARRTGSQQKMLKSYSTSLQVGMTKQQVIEMFGPPDGDRGKFVEYSLGSRGLGVDIDFLTIEFDDNNKVTRFRLIRG